MVICIGLSFLFSTAIDKSRLIHFDIISHFNSNSITASTKYSSVFANSVIVFYLIFPAMQNSTYTNFVVFKQFLFTFSAFNGQHCFKYSIRVPSGSIQSGCGCPRLSIWKRTQFCQFPKQYN